MGSRIGWNCGGWVCGRFCGVRLLWAPCGAPAGVVWLLWCFGSAVGPTLLLGTSGVGCILVHKPGGLVFAADQEMLCVRPPLLGGLCWGPVCLLVTVQEPRKGSCLQSPDHIVYNSLITVSCFCRQPLFATSLYIVRE